MKIVGIGCSEETNPHLYVKKKHQKSNHLGSCCRQLSLMTSERIKLKDKKGEKENP